MSSFSARASLALWRRRFRFRAKKVRQHRNGPLHTKWLVLKGEAAEKVALRERQLEAKKPLRLKALEEAKKLTGVMEEGGNNRGPKVDEIIKANGGIPGEPWCGDFVAYCYRKAGSKAVSRSWASVYLLGRLVGVKKVSKPLPGDIVRYSFDHTGLFEKWVNATEFLAREGNTGLVGAVSDSKTGGDGVYQKRRSVSQVTDFRRVTR